MYTITGEFNCTYFFTSSGVVRKVWKQIEVNIAEAYLEPTQTFMIKHFAQIANGL